MHNPFAGMTFRLSTKNADPLSVADYRKLARRKVPAMVWAYIDGGADDGWTVEENRRAFSRHTFRPRVLTGHEDVSLDTTLGSARLSLPVYLAPTGMTGLAHWTGEAAAARAAENAGTRAIISTAASYTPEEIAATTREDHLFQLYPWADPAAGARDFSQQLIRRVHAAGFGGLVVTVDVPVHGNRESEKRRGMDIPPVLLPARLVDAALRPGWSLDFVRRRRTAARVLLDQPGPGGTVASARRQLRLTRPDLTWDDLAWIREQWADRPLLVKGILHPDDADRAIQLGADGIIVSNHGGRQLDGTIAALDALPAVVARVAGRVPVHLDGGIRRGTDVIKALCLGASAVGIGRPFVYGLAARGQQGVEHVLDILRQEIVRGLTLLGCPGVDQLDPSYLCSGARS